MTQPPLILPEPCLQSGAEEYREIPLTQGLVAIVDECDWEYLMQWKWYARCNKTRVYAARRGKTKKSLGEKRKHIHMHQEVLNMHGIRFELVDHINRNGLDNRLNNLRSTTAQLNMMNTSLKQTNTSGYKGVSFSKEQKAWRASIRMDKGCKKHLGYFTTPQEAGIAYNKAAYLYYGDYAWLNPIEEAART